MAAERAGAKGLNVVLFEKRELGGVCLNEGCIPTKTLLYSAKIYDYAKHGDKYGVKLDLAQLSYYAEEMQAQIALFGHTHQMRPTTTARSWTARTKWSANWSAAWAPR